MRCVLRRRLALHGQTFSGVYANQHFACSLSLDYRVQNSILLSNADLTRKVLQDLMLSAYREMEIARGKKKRTGTGNALVAPDWSGRGNGCDENNGRRGGGNRRKSRKNGNKGGPQQVVAAAAGSAARKRPRAWGLERSSTAVGSWR